MRNMSLVVVALAAMLGVAPRASAQVPVTEADLTRLEASVAEIDRLLESLSKTDATLAAEVRRSLTEARDEVTYLKVKLRREGRVTRDEYSGLRDRLETLRVRASGQRVSGRPVSADDPQQAVTVPVGTQFEVRLQTPLNSGTAKIEQRFEATMLRDHVVGSRVVIPAGALVRGFVSSVNSAGRLDRRGSLTLSFDELKIDATTMRLRASVVQALDPKVSEDVARIGAGAVVGGIVGGLLGGGKGALIGVMVGGGGTMAATGGSEVDLPLGTVLRIRLDQPLEVIVR